MSKSVCEPKKASVRIRDTWIDESDAIWLENLITQFNDSVGSRFVDKPDSLVALVDETIRRTAIEGDSVDDEPFSVFARAFESECYQSLAVPAERQAAELEDKLNAESGRAERAEEAKGRVIQNINRGHTRKLTFEVLVRIHELASRGKSLPQIADAIRWPGDTKIKRNEALRKSLFNYKRPGENEQLKLGVTMLRTLTPTEFALLVGIT